MEGPHCPNRCKPDTDTPFYYPSCCTFDEMGVLAFPNGEPSNRWVDGVAGVSQGVLEELDSHDLTCMHCVECGEGVEVK